MGGRDTMMKTEGTEIGHTIKQNLDLGQVR